MERLTKRIEDCVYYTQGKYAETIPAEMYGNDVRKVLRKLADYEDAEEQGLLLRLPFEVEKEIYVITRTFDVMKNTMSHIVEIFEIKEFKYNFLKNFVIVGRQRKNDMYERHFFLGEIGKTVFLTKEEAEQALAEMKEN